MSYSTFMHWIILPEGLLVFAAFGESCVFVHCILVTVLWVQKGHNENCDDFKIRNMQIFVHAMLELNGS